MQAEEVNLIEQGALAHKNLEDIISAQYNVVANYFIIAKGLAECQEMSWWKVLGDDSFNAFLGRPELGFKRSWAYELIKIYKLYVQRLGVSAEDFIHIGPTKLLKMASVVESNQEEWLGKAKALSVSDLAIEIEGREPGETKSPLSSTSAPAPSSSLGCVNGCQGDVDKHHFPVGRVSSMDEKGDWTIPLCRKCHTEYHQEPKEWTWTYRKNWMRYLVSRGE